MRPTILLATIDQGLARMANMPASAAKTQLLSIVLGAMIRYNASNR